MSIGRHWNIPSTEHLRYIFYLSSSLNWSSSPRQPYLLLLQLLWFLIFSLFGISANLHYWCSRVMRGMGFTLSKDATYKNCWKKENLKCKKKYNTQIKQSSNYLNSTCSPRINRRYRQSANWFLNIRSTFCG